MAGEPMKLHEYQNLMADALYEADSVIAIAAMGAGKTVTTLTALSDLLKSGEVKQALVVAPVRVAQTVWKQEAAKWPHLCHLDIQILQGTPARRAHMLDTMTPDIWVTNYELAEWLKGQGVNFSGAVVFDEVSRLKSHKGRRRKFLLQVVKHSKIRWGLTGTPKGNSPLDLWGMADAMVPGCWGPFTQWRGRFFFPLDRDQHMWKVLPGCEEIIDEQFAEICFKLDPSLIPVSPTPTMVTDTVMLPAPAMRQYKEMYEELVFELADGQDVMALSATGVGMKCRQIASGSVYDDDGGAHWLHDAKLDALQEIIEGSGEPVLVLYQFLPEVAAMRRRWPGLKVLGGETTPREALANMEAWNRGEVQIMAGHPASMGHGLNLQAGGRRVVWFSLTWSLEEYQQANARLARQGQRQQVYVHHLIAKDTIDAVVMKALGGKHSSQERLVAQIKELT